MGSRSSSPAGRAERSSRSRIIEVRACLGSAIQRGNSAGSLEGTLELTQEPPPRHRLSPEPLEVSGLLLAVDQSEAAPGELAHQGRERHFRGVRLGVEHRLAEEHGADRDAVEPAGEASIDPALGGVRVAQSVEVTVRLDHRLADPGSVLVAPAGRGAAPDHPLERGVAADLEPPGAQHLAQRSADVELRGTQHEARVGAEPEHRVVDLAERPGKDAGAVGREQALGREVAADREQTARVGQLRRREDRLGTEPERTAQHHGWMLPRQ